MTSRAQRRRQRDRRKRPRPAQASNTATPAGQAIQASPDVPRVPELAAIVHADEVPLRRDVAQPRDARAEQDGSVDLDPVGLDPVGLDSVGVGPISRNPMSSRDPMSDDPVSLDPMSAFAAEASTSRGTIVVAARDPEFVWPPSVEDLDAIEVVHLTPPASEPSASEPPVPVPAPAGAIAKAAAEDTTDVPVPVLSWTPTPQAPPHATPTSKEAAAPTPPAARATAAAAPMTGVRPTGAAPKAASTRSIPDRRRQEALAVRMVDRLIDRWHEAPSGRIVRIAVAIPLLLAALVLGMLLGARHARQSAIVSNVAIEAAPPAAASARAAAERPDSSSPAPPPAASASSARTTAPTIARAAEHRAPALAPSAATEGSPSVPSTGSRPGLTDLAPSTGRVSDRSAHAVDRAAAARHRPAPVLDRSTTTPGPGSVAGARLRAMDRRPAASLDPPVLVPGAAAVSGAGDALGALDPVASPARRAEASGVVGPGADAVRIRETLGQYERAYDALDARAAAAVWPSLDVAALSRAFSTLKSQAVTFDRCRILGVGPATATASCTGSTTVVRRIGHHSPIVEPLQWTFTLHRHADTWQIDSVRIAH